MEEDIEEHDSQFLENQITGNTSLVINKLENVFEHNENQIDLMESFINKKTTEIATLQEYLIAEFQSLENSKARNKNIEKTLVTKTIPLLHEITKCLETFKNSLAPFATIAFSYVSALSSKANEILAQKMGTIRQQADTIKELNEVITNLKKEKEQSKVVPQQIRDKKEEVTSMPINMHAFEPQLKLSQKVEKLDAHTPTNYEKLGKANRSRETYLNQSKSPNKPNKYEEYYHNILESKKQFLNYRCERPLSPLQTNVQPRRQEINKQQIPLKYQRKEYIKQKIQKIKIRTQCKERKNQFSFYEKNS